MIARDIFIVIGGRVYVFDIFGVEFGIMLDEVLNLIELLKKMVIVGSGYIVVEFVGIFVGFGVEVDLVYC